MGEKYEVSAYLVAEGLPSVDEIMSHWNGDSVSTKPILGYHTDDYLEISSPLPPEEISLNAHLDALLDMLEQRAETVKELGEKYKAWITCTAHLSDTRHGFKLSASSLRRCADLNLDLNFEEGCSNSEQEEAINLLRVSEQESMDNSGGNNILCENDLPF